MEAGPFPPGTTGINQEGAGLIPTEGAAFVPIPVKMITRKKASVILIELGIIVNRIILE